MSGNENSCNRRKILRSAGVLSASLATPYVASSAKAKPDTGNVTRSDRIPERVARRIARARVEHNSQRAEFSEFDPNGLAEPELFYAVSESNRRFGSASKEYVPSAWVYPIKNGGTEVGHIAVSARPESPGVIKCGTGRAPQNRLLEDQVLRNGRSLSAKNDLRFVYNNPMSFGVGVNSRTYVDLKSGQTTSIDSVTTPEVPSAQDRQGNAVLEQNLENERISFEPLDTGYVSSVPNWNGHVCDRNGNWVGCVPVSSAMCIGYHENISFIDCDLMWELHELMGTDNAGNTYPYRPGQKDFLSGIEDYDSSYNSGYELNGKRKEIKSEIDSGRPCIVGYFGDKSPNAAAIEPAAELPDMPTGHAETVIGYEEDDSSWWDPTQPTLYATTHDTYGNTNELTLTSTSVGFVVLEIEK